MSDAHPPLEPPIGLVAELSHRCPQRCVYCSNPVALERKSAEISTASWERVFAQAAELGVLQVHLSGGEPTVRPDLEALVEAARGVDLYTNLITSGVLLDRDRLQALVNAGLDHVQLSVQAASAGCADRVAGLDGAHAKKLEVARWVRQFDLPLTINAVVHRQNLHELAQIIEMAAELDASRLEVAHTQYYGWALENRAALMPTAEQVREATRLVDEARDDYAGQMQIDYVTPDYHARRPKACMGGWGRRLLVVSPSGLALPCHAAQSIEGLEFDNVEDRPLGEIWRHSQAFERFRGTGWMPEPCRSCDRREIDWGGCRCQAFALTGDAANPDPVCELSDHHQDLARLARRAAHQPNQMLRYRSFTNSSDT
ncbi:pyrroloquinoline quinone biosynthesis protein PqqE [Persicimonas caeni]|uniref:PqqA peptide cyclase n=1 Tax=Persicimonas caeni TaxID=2292766 RepID=A0A4Y6PXQ9_PERCE|nr:pyrroloquinoline quinone biosynthesis protein PqqE [Persicimonas caeni]QDG53020.1 pyrroloquinoline quinone biosynthesis protein PqqE [Persicimonas caeni]QED34242.1 pyrroloquinoline quinone biosynthesis protein PqqE [Persicimonas caeni]